MNTYDNYELSGDKNSYHWSLEDAGATVHKFESFGSYQGEWLAKVTYNDKTGWIKDYYGSCSGCDSFEAESGYKKRTKEEWKKFNIGFCKDYLEDLRTFDDVMKMVKENIKWDMEAKEMVEWMKKNK